MTATDRPATKHLHVRYLLAILATAVDCSPPRITTLVFDKKWCPNAIRSSLSAANELCWFISSAWCRPFSLYFTSFRFWQDSGQSTMTHMEAPIYDLRRVTNWLFGARDWEQSCVPRCHCNSSLERLTSRHHRSTVLTIIVSSYGFVFQRLHVKLANLLLVVPATSATARRSFSCLRGNNTWINSTVSQWHLNITAIFHCYPVVNPDLDGRFWLCWKTLVPIGWRTCGGCNSWIILYCE